MHIFLLFLSHISGAQSEGRPSGPLWKLHINRSGKGLHVWVKVKGSSDLITSFSSNATKRLFVPITLSAWE